LTPRIGEKVPNKYFQVSGILGKVTINFWKFLAIFINNLKTFRHYYRNTIIITLVEKGYLEHQATVAKLGAHMGLGNQVGVEGPYGHQVLQL
jgi:hypothetical protein